IRGRKRSAHTPIIFITAYADEMNTAQGYKLGAVDYVLSPVVPEVLRTKVRVFVELYLMAQQVRRQADERVAVAKEQAARAAGARRRLGRGGRRRAGGGAPRDAERPGPGLPAGGEQRRGGWPPPPLGRRPAPDRPRPHPRRPDLGAERPAAAHLGPRHGPGP